MVDSANSNVTSGRNVVIGVDGTDLSMQALRHIASVIPVLGAKAVVVFVRHMPVTAAEPGSEGAVVAVLDSLDELEREVREEVTRLFAGTSVSWSLEVRNGDPADEILDVAHGCDAVCVAIGSTIHGAVSSLLVSSVAQHLLHHSDISLVIIRPDKES